MESRRKFVVTLAATFVGMGLVVASVLADELLGTIIKVDFETKKVTVIEKDKDEELVSRDQRGHRVRHEGWYREGRQRRV